MFWLDLFISIQSKLESFKIRSFINYTRGLLPGRMGGGTSKVVSSDNQADSPVKGRGTSVHGRDLGIINEPSQKTGVLSKQEAVSEQPVRTRKAAVNHRVQPIDRNSITDENRIVYDKSKDENTGYKHVTSESTRLMSPAVAKLIKDALSGINILTSDNEANILSSMDRQEYPLNHILITKGEPGDCLYIVESGVLEVVIEEDVIRSMGPGSTIGELALLYDAPRSATVRCSTKTVMWSLKREVFNKVQVASASEAYLRYSRWLINIPEIAVLSALDLSRLVASLRPVVYDKGDILVKEGEVISKCILIDKGKTSLLSLQKKDLIKNNKEYNNSNNTREDIKLLLEREFLIIRPNTGEGKEGGGVADSTGGSGTGTGWGSGVEKRGDNSSWKLASSKQRVSVTSDTQASPSIPTTPINSERLSSSRRISLSRKSESKFTDETSDIISELDEGCFIGLGILRGKARIPGSWPWNLTVRDEEGALEVGAVSPITVVATERVEALTFTVNIFENLFGDIDLVSSAQCLPADHHAVLFTHHKQSDTDDQRIIPSRFTEDNFKQTYILGSGTYAVVTIGEFIPTTDLNLVEGGTSTGQYALKVISKSDMVEMGQVKHVLDEAKLLGMLLLYMHIIYY